MAHLGLEPCLRNGGEEPEVAVAIRLRSVTNRPSLKSWPRPVPQVLFFVVSALSWPTSLHPSRYNSCTKDRCPGLIWLARNRLI